MAEKRITKTSQTPLVAEFTWNFDDTMVDKDGVTKDFGKTTVTAAANFDVIKLPPNSVVLSGELVTETAFDTASYAVIVGDAETADRYLATADRKGAARVPLVPTGYRNDTGSDIRVGITNADVCTAGKATLRVEYVIAGRVNEVA